MEEKEIKTDLKFHPYVTMKKKNISYVEEISSWKWIQIARFSTNLVNSYSINILPFRYRNISD